MEIVWNPLDAATTLFDINWITDFSPRFFYFPFFFFTTLISINPVVDLAAISQTIIRKNKILVEIPSNQISLPIFRPSLSSQTFALCQH